MSGIDFAKKMSFQRHFSRAKTAEDEYTIVRQFESDRGRIINSAAIRRLQQKTQVFPLERNAAVRSRLTHSMEVQQVGRYIAKEILHRLKVDVRLAALVSSQAEQHFELGMRINFAATHNSPERIRSLRTCSQWLMTSSAAASGGELPAQVDDPHVSAPLSSYRTP